MVFRLGVWNRRAIVTLVVLVSLGAGQAASAGLRDVVAKGVRGRIGAPTGATAEGPAPGRHATKGPNRIAVKLKPGISVDSLPADVRRAVRSADRLFPDRSAPEDTLRRLKAEKSGHDPLFSKIDAHGAASLDRRIRALEDRISRIARRRGRAPRTARDPGLERVHLLQLDDGTDVGRTVADLRRQPGVEYAHALNRVQAFDTVPDDPRFAEQWAHAKIASTAAWDCTTGSPRVVIAIIDTGTDYTHPDLAANIWSNPAEIPGNGIDDDGNGFVDDVRGWDFVGADCENPLPDNDPFDDQGHGTHTAGIAAAVGNNGTGIAGVSWNAAILPVKGLDANGSGYDDQLALAIRYAVDMGAEILSNSWGGYGDSAVISDAVNYAISSGCIVVAAAGNDSMPTAPFPGGIPGVVGVAATNRLDLRSNYSNFGSWVSVAAPGDHILSTLPAANAFGIPGGYGELSGTSMATPHVAGLAALVLAAHQDDPTPWSSALVTGQVLNTADPLPADPYFASGLLGSGRINSNAALNTTPGLRLGYAGHRVVDPNGDSDGMIDPGERVDLYVDVKNSWLAAADVTVTIESLSDLVMVISGTAAYGAIDSMQRRSAAAPFVLQATASAPIDSDIPIRMTITAAGGYSRTETFTIVSRISNWKWQGPDFGPAGGPMVRSVAVAPGRIYAAAGRSWFHPIPDERDGLYEGVMGPGRVVAWRRFGSAEGFPAIYSAFEVLASPDGTVLYALCGSGDVFSGTYADLYRSTDGGGHWTMAADLDTALGAWESKLFMDPMHSTRLHALASGAAYPSLPCSFHYSLDGGSHWYRTMTFPGGGWDESPYIMDAAAVPGDGSRFYLGGGTGGNWWSTTPVPDLFSLWASGTARERVGFDLQNATVSTVGVTAAGVRAYIPGVGLERSADEGRSWTLATEGLESVPEVRAILGDTVDPRVEYIAGGGSGVLNSVDEGRSWRTMNSGDYPQYPYWLAQEVESPRRLYAMDLFRGGVYSFEPYGPEKKGPVTISGCVRTSSGTGIAGALMTFSDGGGVSTTDPSGCYSRSVDWGWNGTATPSRANTAFTPPSKSYRFLTDNVSAQDYAGTPVPVPPPSLSLQFPAGGETFVKGQKFAVRWLADNVAGDIRIDLYRESASVLAVAAAAPDSGYFPLTLPADLPDGPDYRIKIAAMGDTVSSGSGTFAILAGAAPPASLTLVAPAGGETLDEGQPCTVRWQGANVQGNVEIELRKGDRRVASIGGNLPNTGSHAFTVPDLDFPGGSDYRIAIEAMSGTVADISAPFSIRPMPKLVPKFPHPDGGTAVIKGEDVVIEWKAEGVTGDLLIDLYRGDTFVDTIMHYWEQGDGFAKRYGDLYAFPADLPDGADYRIVVSTLDGRVSGSGGFFSLVTATAPPAFLMLDYTRLEDTLFRGKTVPIAWISENLDKEFVTVELHKGTLADPVLSVRGRLDAGSLMLPVLPDLPPGADYWLVIRAYGSEVGDIGGWYTVRDPRNPLPTLGLISPNGLETLETGRETAIVWSSTSVTGNVRIDLYGGDYWSMDLFRLAIADNVANNGIYRFTPPVELPESPYYWIRIAALDGSTSDKSDLSFRIKPPDRLWPEAPAPSSRVFHLSGTVGLKGSPADPNDELAAFCVHRAPGGQTNRWETRYAGWGRISSTPGQLPPMAVYGDDPATADVSEGCSPGEEIQLVLWSKSDQRKHFAYLDAATGEAATLTWGGDGLANDNVTLDFVDGNRYPLRSGQWNLMSFGVLKGYFKGESQPASARLDNVAWEQVGSLDDAMPLRSLRGRYDRILGNDGGGTKTHDPMLQGFSTLTSLAPGYGYWIKIKPSTDNQELAWMTVPGAPAAGSEALSLNAGWMLAGYWGNGRTWHAAGVDPAYQLGPVSATDNAGLSSFGDLWGSLSGNLLRAVSFDGAGAHIWNPSQPGFSTMRYLAPGQGYWIRLNAPGTLRYPEGTK